MLSEISKGPGPPENGCLRHDPLLERHWRYTLHQTTLWVVHDVSEAPEVGHDVRNVSDIPKVVHEPV